ncbi:MAG: 16S rRNA (cytosine(1402)-N(4))-methyltransferase RsmH [Candidatus Roizmanbacteria bacterium]
MHTPVLLQQAIENLNVTLGGRYIDATFGEGGYSQEIIRKGGKVLAIDLDESQLKSWRVGELTGLKLVQGNFVDIERIAKENNFFPVDGVVFDLGLSMKQIEESGRGFSYNRPDEPLDMRLSLDNELTVRDLIKRSSEEELYNIFAKNSEEIKSREIANEVKKRKRMETVSDLIEAIDKALGFKSNSTYARIFQALRIETNKELENLKKGLSRAVSILKKNGRIVIVSFHSLEDRIVKNFVKEKKFKFLLKKPIRGLRSYERSAKLRTIIK